MVRNRSCRRLLRSATEEKGVRVKGSDDTLPVNGSYNVGLATYGNQRWISDDSTVGSRP